MGENDDGCKHHGVSWQCGCVWADLQDAHPTSLHPLDFAYVNILASRSSLRSLEHMCLAYNSRFIHECGRIVLHRGGRCAHWGAILDLAFVFHQRGIYSAIDGLYGAHKEASMLWSIHQPSSTKNDHVIISFEGSKSDGLRNQRDIDVVLTRVNSVCWKFYGRKQVLCGIRGLFHVNRCEM